MCGYRTKDTYDLVSTCFSMPFLPLVVVGDCMLQNADKTLQM